MFATPSTITPTSGPSTGPQTGASTPSTSEDERVPESLSQPPLKTDLLELLHHLHSLLFQNAPIPEGTLLEREADQGKPPGGTADEIDPLRPDKLRAWTSFSSEQDEIWQHILESSFASERLFPPVRTLQSRRTGPYGGRYAGIQSFISSITQRVDLYVQSIVRAIADNTALRSRFKLKGTFDPSNDFSSLITQYYPSPPGPDKTPLEIKRANCGRPLHNQVCAYNSPGDRSATNHAVPAFIATYKSLRLTLHDIRNGLEDMDLDSVTPKSSIEDDKARCRRKVAAAISHVVSYMVRAGLEFGYITTGEAWIFLRVPDDPRTVLYHLSIPEIDVRNSMGYTANQYQPHHGLCLTAAGQLAAFTLQAFQKNPRVYSWREWAVAAMKTWQSTPAPSQTAGTQNEASQQGESIRMSGAQFPGQHITLPSTTGGDSLRQKYNGLPYCTEACLSSMRKKGWLQDCPNKHLHGTFKHKIDNRKFLQLLRRQLKATYDSDFEPTGLAGSRAALMKVTLSSHGYTVAAKCTPRVFTPRLRHERKIYRRLQSIQGKHVPRYLGLVRLQRPYHYAGVTDVDHMMVLGNAGESFGTHESTMDHDAMTEYTQQAFDSIHRFGVLHNDAHPFNLRYNTETGTVMVFDFDRAIMDSRGRKRKRSDGDDDSGNSDCAGTTGTAETSSNSDDSMSSEARQASYREETELACGEVEDLVEDAHVAKRRRLAEDVWGKGGLSSESSEDW